MAKHGPVSVTEAVSASLLKLGSTLETQGKIHQALTPYLRLVEQYAGSQEAPLAIERVLAIVENLREKGQYHVAMTVCDRLEAAHQQRDV
jgi:hypothetical protein